ncbi:MAG: hypothetical protein AAF639_47735, partial [Chloroflexota bacterium]
LIFVETSVQIERVLADKSEKIKLENHFERLSTQLYTTNYVWMEFQRTIVADVAHIQRVMSTQYGWGDLMVNLLIGQRAFRPRSAVRCTQMLGHLHNQSNGNWRYARLLLEQLIQERFKRQFWTNVNPLSDLITCDLVTKGVSRTSSGDYTVAATCNKETAACFLPNFIEQNLDKLRILDAYLTAHTKAIKDQARVQRLLTTVIDNPQAVLGQNSCWPLGDIIIALQVPDGASVWTLDADFEPIVEALGLSLYTTE